MTHPHRGWKASVPPALWTLLLVTCAAGAAAQPIRVPDRFQPPGSWADLAEAVDPAVVSIQAATIETRPPRDPDADPPGRPSAPRDPDGKVDPFEFFFGPPKPGAEEKPESRADAGGSGFLISRDGLVVTNYHVIEGASQIHVRLGGRDYPARVRGADSATDLALLQIQAGRDLPYLELGDSDALRVGDWVMVIGNPLNLDKTVTTGVVSAKGRSVGITDVSFENFIQTDAAINFGNSGGPLIDMHGRVVAIATAINYGAENIGFAVPANTLRDILPQLRDKGRVSRGYLGVNVANLDFSQASAFGLTDTGGALIEAVQDGSPGQAAGLEHGDVILAVDGRKVEITRDLIQYVAAQGPGTAVTLDIVRDGQAMQKQVTVRERPGPTAEEAPSPEPEGDEASEWPGIELEDLSPTARETYGITPEVLGVLVSEVAPTSPLYEQFVRPGCVIGEVNRRPVGTAREVEQAMASAKPGSYLRLYVYAPADADSQARRFFAVVQVP